MTRRPSDKAPEPLGGRAAERLRMFEDARRPIDTSQGQKKTSTKATKKRAPTRKGGNPNEKQTR